MMHTGFVTTEDGVKLRSSSEQRVTVFDFAESNLTYENISEIVHMTAIFQHCNVHMNRQVSVTTFSIPKYWYLFFYAVKTSVKREISGLEAEQGGKTKLVTESLPREIEAVIVWKEGAEAACGCKMGGDGECGGSAIAAARRFVSVV